MNGNRQREQMLLLPVSYMTVAKAGRWSFAFPKYFFKTGCSKRDFLSDQIGGLFKTANDAFSSEHFVNFCEKGSKKCVLAAYHIRDFFGGVRTGNAGAEM
ncbi:MAG: hypothetical protein ACLR8L_03205 [Oscillospiraceae bacterium]